MHSQLTGQDLKALIDSMPDLSKPVFFNIGKHLLPVGRVQINGDDDVIWPVTITDEDSPLGSIILSET